MPRPHLLPAWICLLGVGLVPSASAGPTEDAAFAATVAPVLKRYCLDCHRGDKPKGDLNLETLIADPSKHVKQWQAVQERLVERTMPPRGRPQPTDAEVKAAGDWVAGLQKAHPETRGRALLRRLNRVEYNNAVRDLLGIDVDLVDLLPEDGKASGFDNVDAALDLSSTLLERYLDAADVALDAALAHGPRPAQFQKRVDLAEVSRGLIAKNKPPLFGAKTLDDCIEYLNDPPATPKVIRDAEVPGPGRYRFRISAAAHRDEDRQVSMRVYAGYGDSHRSWLAGVFDVGPQPTVVEFTERLARRDSINIGVNGVTHRWNVPGDYAGPALALYRVEVEGPLCDPWPSAGFTRLMGGADPDKGTLADAEAILRRFTRRAYRRPVADADIAPLLGLVRSRLDRGVPFLDALRVALSAVLCGPDFLYLKSSPGRLDDFELAARLSFFLWSSTPDDALLDLAAAGRLGTPNVLRAQVERLLADPKARAFTENFTGQWLNLRALRATDPDPRLYPEFDALLEWSLPRETHLFFEEVLQQDRSLLDFVQSDWSMLNGRLAEHYGIPGVKQQHFRKVALPPGSHRGGVLTQASVLKVTANGTSTSPVTRGVFVLDRILGKPAPPPPPNVPAVEPDIRGATTIREQLARHRSVGACASCHERIDPPGFALESFDPIGGWRERYRVTPSGKYRAAKTRDYIGEYAEGPSVECGDEMPGGKKFTDIDSFRRLLLDDKDQVARALAGRLLIYATGHGLEPGDRATVDALVAAIRKKNYGFRSLIHELVQSDAFRSK